MDPLLLFAISPLIFVCAYVIYVAMTPKRKKARIALKRFTELGIHVDAWWNLSQKEWKESFKDPNTKELFTEAIAAYDEMIAAYPPLPHYRSKLELAKNWCEFIEMLEEGKKKLAEALPAIQQIYRLNCETTITDAMRMSRTVGESHPEIHADWYSEILMEYYYAIVLNRTPPEEKDLN